MMRGEWERGDPREERWVVRLRRLDSRTWVRTCFQDSAEDWEKADG